MVNSKTFVNDRILQFYTNVFIDTGDIFAYAAKDSHLNPVHWKMMTVISMEEPDVTVGDLSRILKMNKGNCSTACKDLATRGYVTRERSARDERIVFLMLTDSGHEVIEDLARNMEKAAQMAFGDDSMLRVQELFTTMRRVEEDMHILAERCRMTGLDRTGDQDGPGTLDTDTGRIDLSR